nr:general secretion pathway protein GspK [Granulosicoccus sp.]
NASFVSVSELQLVKGFSTLVEEEQADYELLMPHITALPTPGGPTPVNVNTATPQVMASLSEFLQPLGADLSRWDTEAYSDYPDCENIFDLAAEETSNTLEDQRDTTPYESTLIFEDSAAPESGEQIAEPGSYDVRSNYYQVRIDVTTEGVKLTQYTLLRRDPEGRSEIVRRSIDAL